MLDDTSMFHQQQLDPHELEMLQKLHNGIAAMPDKEFFELLDSVDKEKIDVSLQGN